MAIADDCIRKNPFDFKLATVIKRDVTEREPVSREQVDALLGFMRSEAVYHRYIDEVVILLGTVLRISEMCGLTEADIDLTNRVILVDHQIARSVGGGYRVDEPQTESGRRYIYMTDEVMAAFEHVMASRPKAKPLNVDGPVGGGYRVDEPQTESGRRYIYMTDEVMAAFEHVMASRPKAKPLNVDGRTGFIFLNRDGLPRVGGDYDRVFRGLGRRGIPGR